MPAKKRKINLEIEYMVLTPSLFKLFEALKNLFQKA